MHKMPRRIKRSTGVVQEKGTEYMSENSPAEFTRQVRQEIGRITWPTRKETMISTVMVLIMVAIAALFFYCVDSIIGFAVGRILGFGG